VISLKIIPDRQRLALLREGRPCRLLGPGIVVVLRLPGRQIEPISIGDRGLLVAPGRARFGYVFLPVELRGEAPSTMVQVIGFRDNTVLVEDCGNGADLSDQHTGDA
jgi:hypothetical protein